MVALSPRSRAFFGCAALAAYAAAFILVPTGAWGTDGVQPSPPRPSPDVAEEKIAVVIPRRDPFAGDLTSPGGSQPTPQSPAAMPPLPPIPARIAPLPPNAGALGEGTDVAAARVTAIVTGDRASAVIDDAGHGRLVTIGDELDGERITGIDLAGIHLAGGATVPIAPPIGQRSSPDGPAAPRTAPPPPLPALPPPPPSGERP